MPTNALSKYIELGQAYKSGQITSSDVAATAPQPQAPAGGSSGYEALGRAYKSGQITSSDISSTPSQGRDMQSSLNSLLSVVNGGSALQSNLRVTPDKWNFVNGEYEAYENNRNSPDFVYDENVNRNQYNSIKSLMDDIDADIAFYRQQGENITVDNLQYNKEQLQENLDKLDKEYNDNKAPEVPAFQGIDTSIQKTLGSTAEYNRKVSDLERQIAMLESTNHRGVIGQDTDAVSGELYDVYGNVNDAQIHQLKEQLQNISADRAAATRAEQREALRSNADFAEKSATSAPMADDDEAVRLTKQLTRSGIGFGGDVWIPTAAGRSDANNAAAKDILSYASDEEHQMFNYILNTQGEDAARDYIDDLLYDLHARQASANSQQFSEEAAEYPVFASGLSVGQNLISGAGLVDTAVQNLNRDITGNNKRIDYNTWANQQSQQVQATRGTIAQELTDKYGTKNILGKDVSWGDAYQLGMSMLDSGAAAATGLGSASALALGAAAGSQATQEAVRNGASDSQALTLGFAAMVAETVTEKVSLENLLKAPGKTILTNALRQAGIEASEEAASTILNELANETVMDEDSDFNKRVRELEANGVSHEEAQQQSWNQFGTQLLWDAIGGAISGGVMGSISKGIQGETNTQTQQNTETTAEQTRAPDNELLNTLSQYDNAQIQAINRNNTNNALSQTLADYDNQQLAELRNIQNTNARAEIDRQNEAIRAENENIRNQNAQIQEAQAEQRFANEVWDEASERAANAPSITQFKKQNADWLKTNGYSSADATNLWNSIHKDIDAHKLTEQEELALTYDSKAQFRADLVAQSDGQISYAEAGEIYDSARNKNRWNQEQQAARERTRTANENPLVNAALQEERAELDYPTNPLTRTVQNAQNASQNSPLEQTSEAETNNVSTGTTPSAIEAQQTASAPRVTENTTNTTENTAQVEPQQTEAQAYRPAGQGKDVREHNTSERIRERKTIVHDALVEETQADPSYYKVKHNKDTVAAAEAVLFNEDGSEADLNEVASHAEEKLSNARNGTGKIMPEDVLISVQAADRLMEHANVLEQSGLTQEAQSERARADRIMSALYAEQAEAGQLSQAGRLISKASPATQRQMRQDYLDRCLKEWNDRLTKGQGRKMQKKTGANTVQLPTELAEAYVNAKTDADLQKAYSDIVTYVGQNTPSTFYQQITALRFLNMLGNPVTQGRNIIGNTFSFANYFVKRRMQSVLESVFAPDDKTFSMWYDLNDARAWLGLTSDPEIAANLENNGRFQDVRTQSRSKFARDSIDNQTIFGIKPIEGYRKVTNKATSGGDIIFLKMNFADAAAAYAKAHGFTLETATPEQKAVAIAVATKEAQEATFHDDTVISDIATKMRIDEGGEWANKNRANKAATKIVNALSDGLQPFRKTPANVAVRGEEFSPLGFINALIKSGVRFHDIMTTGSSEITTSDVINQLSKALTGTGLTIAGAMLRAAGKARTSDDDDKKLNDYEKLNGLQDYAIKINGKWKTADWAAPDSIPFFMGVELYDALNGTGQFTEDDIINVFGALTGTMTEMSMLQGINDTLKGLNSFGGDDNALMKFVTALGTSYLQQLLGNSLLGRAESAATPYRQDTYLDPDSRLSSETQYALGKLGNKIPFWDFQQADYIDAWGNKVENQNTSSPITRALRSLGSPSYTSEDTTTDFDRGLMELHDQLEGTDFKGDVLPAHISRSTVIGDKRLTPEEYEIYATNVGQMRREMAESFWNSSLRETLSPEEQGKVITDIYEYCASRGKADILERRGESLSANDDWADDIEFFGDDANRLTKYLATKDAFNDNLNNGDYEAIDALLKTIDSFTDNDGEFANKDTQYYVDNIQGLEKYVLAAKQGVTSDMLTEAKEAYNGFNKQKGLSKSEMTTRFTSWVDNNVQTADWTDKQKDAVKSLLKYYNQVPVNTDRYERMGEYGVDSRTITAIESDIETLKASAGYEDLNDTQKKYRQYEAVLKRAATLSDDQALELVRSYGSLGPGGGAMKYMIQQYFGDKPESFQEELYNAYRDENKSSNGKTWGHNWGRTKPDNPFD